MRLNAFIRSRGLAVVPVLLALSAVAVGALYWLGAAGTQSKKDFLIRQESTIDLVKQTLAGYLFVYSRLPCPDIPVVGEAEPYDGVEDCTGAQSSGYLPYRTLGLSQQIAGNMVYAPYNPDTTTGLSGATDTASIAVPDTIPDPGPSTVTLDPLPDLSEDLKVPFKKDAFVVDIIGNTGSATPIIVTAEGTYGGDAATTVNNLLGCRYIRADFVSGTDTTCEDDRGSIETRLYTAAQQPPSDPDPDPDGNGLTPDYDSGDSANPDLQWRDGSDNYEYVESIHDELARYIFVQDTRQTLFDIVIDVLALSRVAAEIDQGLTDTTPVNDACGSGETTLVDNEDVDDQLACLVATYNTAASGFNAGTTGVTTEGTIDSISVDFGVGTAKQRVETVSGEVQDGMTVADTERNNAASGSVNLVLQADGAGTGSRVAELHSDLADDAVAEVVKINARIDEILIIIADIATVSGFVSDYLNEAVFPPNTINDAADLADFKASYPAVVTPLSDLAIALSPLTELELTSQATLQAQNNLLTGSTTVGVDGGGGEKASLEANIVIYDALEAHYDHLAEIFNLLYDDLTRDEIDDFNTVIGGDNSDGTVALVIPNSCSGLSSFSLYVSPLTTECTDLESDVASGSGSQTDLDNLIEKIARCSDLNDRYSDDFDQSTCFSNYDGDTLADYATTLDRQKTCGDFRDDYGAAAVDAVTFEYPEGTELTLSCEEAYDDSDDNVFGKYSEALLGDQIDSAATAACDALIAQYGADNIELTSCKISYASGELTEYEVNVATQICDTYSDREDYDETTCIAEALDSAAALTAYTDALGDPVDPDPVATSTTAGGAHIGDLCAKLEDVAGDAANVVKVGSAANANLAYVLVHPGANHVIDTPNDFATNGGIFAAVDRAGATDYDDRIIAITALDLSTQLSCSALLASFDTMAGNVKLAQMLYTNADNVLSDAEQAVITAGVDLALAVVTLAVDTGAVVQESAAGAAFTAGCVASLGLAANLCVAAGLEFAAAAAHGITLATDAVNIASAGVNLADAISSQESASDTREDAATHLSNAVSAAQDADVRAGITEYAAPL